MIVRIKSIHILGLMPLFLPRAVLAIGSQEDVLKGINESVGETVDPSKLIAGVLVIAAVVVVIVVLNQWMKKRVKSPAVNHPGKLLKEIAKKVNLKPAQIRQLKQLADQKELTSPLVLLLCPSLASGGKARSGKAAVE